MECWMCVLVLLASLHQQEIFASLSSDNCAVYANLYGNKVSTLFVTSRDSIGKQATAKGEFPHMAALGYKTQFGVSWRCAGSLISESFILTSAFCATNNYSNPNRWINYVRLGDHDITSGTDDEGIQEFNVVDTVIYPRTGVNTYYNDIALMELNGTVKFTKYVWPACLYEAEDLSNAGLLATGWGRLYKNETGIMKKVKLDLFSNEECKDVYKPLQRKNKRLKNGIIASQLCAGGKTRPQDTCLGDGGGPLQILKPEKNIYAIVGVASFGRLPCGVVGYPSVYTRVSRYITWIEDVVF